MAFTVEDGSIVAGANSYISLAAAETYFTDHGSPSDWTGTNAVKEAALRVAARWLDSVFDWKGWIVDDDQAMDWPRENVFDGEGRLIAKTAIPQRLKDAQCEAAVEHMRASLVVGVNRGGAVKRQRVEGAVEIEYMDGATGARTRSHIAELLRGLYVSGPGSMRLELG